MEDGGSPYFGLIIFLVLLLMNGWLFAFEAAMDNVNESELEKKKEAGKKNAVLALYYLEEPTAFLQSIRMLTVFNGIFAGVFPIHQYARIIIKELMTLTNNQLLVSIGTYVVLLLIGFWLFAVSALAAHKIGRAKALFCSLSLVKLIHSITILFIPIRKAANLVGNIIVRLFGVDPNASTEEVTEEEIISMVNEGHEQGVLEASEAEMINNIFLFGDKEAGDIMTHRKNMVVISSELTLQEALEMMLEGNNTRYPVYEDVIDNIIGIVQLRDVMLSCHESHLLNQKLKELPELLRDVEFIPETRNINVLFRSMQLNKSHMVIVVDEYGQTSGLVTMEDILEEIVGNIFDEYDEDQTMIICNEDGTFYMDGATEIEDVSEMLNIDIDIDDFETLNGYLISLLDTIPENGKEYMIHDHGYCFKVVMVENKMIQSVEVSPICEENIIEE